MELQKDNFGFNGQDSYSDYDDDYDNLFKKWREKRAEKKEERQQRKDDRRQRKEDRRTERQERRETTTEKRKLKNELKQTQIDEKKAQLSMLNQQVQQPALPLEPGSDNSMMVVVAVVGVIFIAGLGYVMMNKKQTQIPIPVLAAA